MMYLFDTNTISELAKKQPNQNVVHFFDYLEKHNIDGFLSVVTLGEIEFGIEKLKYCNDFAQSARLREWYDKNLPKIVKTTLDFDEQCAKVWGNLMAKNPHNPVDKQLVAIAIVHDLILVTRNVKDIEQTGVKFINPFEFNNNE